MFVDPVITQCTIDYKFLWSCLVFKAGTSLPEVVLNICSILSFRCSLYTVSQRCPLFMFLPFLQQVTRVTCYSTLLSLVGGKGRIGTLSIVIKPQCSVSESQRCSFPGTPAPFPAVHLGQACIPISLLWVKVFFCFLHLAEMGFIRVQW